MWPATLGGPFTWRLDMTKKQQVIEFLKKHPMLNLADVAKVFRTTNAYISQIQMQAPGLAEERETAKNKRLEELGARMYPFAPRK